MSGKNRPNRKAVKRLQQKAARMQAAETAQRIQILAEAITDNRMLRTMLMQEKDVVRRKQLFDFMLPYLKFRNPEFPSLIESARIILP